MADEKKHHDIYIANRGAQQLQIFDGASFSPGLHNIIPPGHQLMVSVPAVEDEEADDAPKKKLIHWLDRYGVEHADQAHEGLPIA